MPSGGWIQRFSSYLLFFPSEFPQEQNCFEVNFYQFKRLTIASKPCLVMWKK
jgi:hypothetical protein